MQAEPSGGRGKAGARRKWRRWVAAVGLVAVGLGAGQLVYDALPRTWVASSTVLVLPTVGGAGGGSSIVRAADTVEIDTEAELARSARVAAAASEKMAGAMSPAALLRGGDVTVPPNSQVLVITLKASSPALAQQGAAALSTAYLEQRSADAAAEQERAVEVLSGQHADLTVRLEENAAQLASLDDGDAGGRALAESQKSLLVNQLAEIDGVLVELRFRTTSGGRIITEAERPSTPSAPIPAVILGAGGLVGSLAAAGLLVLLDVRDRRRAGSGLPVLGKVALREPIGPDGAFQVSALQAAALGPLCTTIERAFRAEGPTVIVGVGNPSLRLQLVHGLNHVMADEHSRSLLVLGHDDSLGQRLGLEGTELGLTDLVSQVVDADALLTTSSKGTGGALVVGSGQTHATMAPSVLRSRLSRAWAALGVQFGAVLVDVPPPFDSAWPQSIVQTAGKIVVAVEVGLETSKELDGVLEDLAWLGVEDLVIGVVMFEPVHHQTVAGTGSTPKSDEAVPAPATESGARSGADDAQSAPPDPAKVPAPASGDFEDFVWTGTRRGAVNDG